MICTLKAAIKLNRRVYNFLVGKAASKEGAVAFNIMASDTYSNMGEDDRNVLKKAFPKRLKSLSTKAMNCEGAKLFAKI